MSDKQARLDQNKLDQSRLHDEQVRIEAEIEGMGKVKGHGEYGIDARGKLCIRFKGGNGRSGFFVVDEEQRYGNDAGYIAVPDPVLGDVFDLIREKIS